MSVVTCLHLLTMSEDRMVKVIGKLSPGYCRRSIAVSRQRWGCRNEQPPAFGLAAGELRFQSVAQGQQVGELGDDAVLLGEGGRRGMPPAS